MPDHSVGFADERKPSIAPLLKDLASAGAMLAFCAAAAFVLLAATLPELPA